MARGEGTGPAALSVSGPGPAQPSTTQEQVSTTREQASTTQEWYVTVDRTTFEILKLERISNLPSHQSKYVVAVDAATGAVANIEILEGSGRRALTPHEYNHMIAIYTAAYILSMYSEPSEGLANYWRAYDSALAGMPGRTGI
jgi:hypothetical protein